MVPFSFPSLLIILAMSWLLMFDLTLSIHISINIYVSFSVGFDFILGLLNIRINYYVHFVLMNHSLVHSSIYNVYPTIASW